MGLNTSWRPGLALPVVFGAVVLGLSSAAFAIDAGNVLVLYNANSADGASIASYYAQKRPGVRTLAITGIGTSEDIDCDTYLQVVRPQVLAALNSTTDVIVSTRGMPLRVDNTHTPTQFPFSYTDPSGVQRTVFSDTYKVYSSLESELTRIDSFSTWKQMGDQTYWLPPTGTNPAANPFFKRGTSFNHTDAANQGIRLSTRLDGYSVADVEASIDHAQKAFIVPFGQSVVVDNSPSAPAGGTNAMPNLVNNVLPAHGQSFVYDNTTAPILSVSAPVIGYDSHGTNDGSGQLGQNYIRDQLNMTLANGAIFQSWESFNAYSFNQGGNHGGQGLVADWIHKGGAGAIGQVEEPGGNLANVTNEDQLYSMMLNGYTWAEAAWDATPQDSYVNTVVGDPLMTWQAWVPGDANLDGTVNLIDFARLQANWLNHGTFDQGDFNGDGTVNLLDFAILQSHWLQTADGGLPSPGLAPPAPAPEPLLAAPLIALLSLRRPHRRLTRPCAAVFQARSAGFSVVAS